MGDEKEPLIEGETSLIERCFGKQGFAMVQLILVMTYLGLNTVLNIYNKYVLSSPEKNGAGTCILSSYLRDMHERRPKIRGHAFGLITR